MEKTFLLLLNLQNYINRTILIFILIFYFNMENNSQPNPFLNNQTINETFNSLFQNSPLSNININNNLNEVINNAINQTFDKNMVTSTFTNMISSNIFPFNLHKPERVLDILLYLSEKYLLDELDDNNAIEFKEFITMFRTSANENPERKLAMFLNLLNYYTEKQNLNFSSNEIDLEDNINIEPVD